MTEHAEIGSNREGNPHILYGPKQRPWSELVPDGAQITAPSLDPLDVYPQVPPPGVEDDLPAIDYRMFQIPPTGLSEAERAVAHEALKAFITTQSDRFTGFQANQGEAYSEQLAWMMDLHANNVGDPFQTGICTINTKFCERAVLDHFAALWNNHWPHRSDEVGQKHPDSQWGYVLSMGSTEANVYGLFNARDYLKGRALIEDPDWDDELRFMYSNPLSVVHNENAYKPIVFYSQDTHYSVIKAVRILELTTFYEEGRKCYPGECPITSNGEWPDEVPSHAGDDGKSGCTDLDALRELVTFFVSRGYPPLIVLNYGSTWKGAFDDVPVVDQMLKDLGRSHPWLWERTVHFDPDRPQHADKRRGFWLHIDGALGAGYMPYVELAHKRGLTAECGPVFDFRNDAVMSICTSMHKWFGAPWPGSVYMTRVGHQLNPPDVAGYIGSADTTLGGSRNAFSAAIFWDYLARHSYDHSVKDVLRCFENVDYFVERMTTLETDLKSRYGDEVDLWITRSKLSLAIRFRLVNPSILYKYTVDSERLWVPISENEERERTSSHIYIMKHVDRELIDSLVDDIASACENDWREAFPDVDGDLPNPGSTRVKTAPTKGRHTHIMRIPHTGRGLGSFLHPSKRKDPRQAD